MNAPPKPSASDPEKLAEAEARRARLTALEIPELIARAQAYGVGVEAFFGARSIPDREL